MGTTAVVGHRVQVALVDNHPLFGQVLRMALAADNRLRIVAHITDPPTACGALAEVKPDVVLVDIGVTRGPGQTLIRDLVGTLPGARVIVLTGCDDHRAVSAVAEAGASGYLTLATLLQDVVEAVVVMGSDRRYGCRPGAPWSLRGSAEPARSRGNGSGSGLTPREREILRHLAAGELTGEIAHGLGISTFTARTHIQNILGKLGVHSKHDAVAYAIRHQLA